MTSYSYDFHFLSMQVLFSVYLLGVVRSSECAHSVFPLLHEHAELCILELKQTCSLLEGKKREEEVERSKGERWKERGEELV